VRFFYLLKFTKKYFQFVKIGEKKSALTEKANALKVGF